MTALPGDIRIQGDKQLIKALNQFKPTKRKQLARKAVRPAASAMSKAMKSRVRHPDEKIEKAIAQSIGRRRKTYGNNDVVLEVVGARTNFESKHVTFVNFHKGKAEPVKVAAAAKQLEFGQSLVWRHIELGPARPFARPAYEASRGKLILLMTRRLEEVVVEALRDAR